MQRSSDDGIGRHSEGRPELPRSEPEIIPPGAAFRPGPGSAAAFDERTGIRVQVVRPGPLGMAAVLVGVGIVGVLILLALLGTLLIGAAAAGIILLATVIARLLRVFRP